MVCFVYSCKSITIKREIIIAPLDIFMIMPGPKKIRSAHFCCALLINSNYLLLYLHLISQLKLTASLRQGGHRNISYRDISPQGEAISQGEARKHISVSLHLGHVKIYIFLQVEAASYYHFIHVILGYGYRL